MKNQSTAKQLLVAVVMMVVVALSAAAKDKSGRIVVATDGTGDFTTLSEALRKVRGDFDTPVTIFVRNGVYKEKILINASVNNLTVEGENPDSVIITYGDYASLNNMGTSATYTIKIEGNNITFRNITFENSAGRVGQAVAVYTIGDKISFYNCRFLGNQDTLYTGGRNSRLYFDNCYIEGTTDFIFGSATALFNRCHIHGKANSYITAASTAAENPVGYVFNHCRVTAAPDVTKLYLGRPWRPYASTAFIGCELPDAIHPAGWDNWRDKANESTARYAESGCTGPGSATDSRVSWIKILSPDEASHLSNPDFIFNRRSNWQP